jgi:peptidoglycan/xylan/chitin deacetylase (PgdA/CDA1 family)
MGLEQYKNIDFQKLLRGEYEAERMPQQFSPESFVPDFAYNVLNPVGALYRPLADEYRLEKGMKKLVWPGGKPFGVCLTHDVDMVATDSMWKDIIRSKVRSSNILSRMDWLSTLMGKGISLSQQVRNGFQKDPLFCFEKWLEAEEQVNAHATFFFWPGSDAVSKPHYTDCSYQLSDKVIFDNQPCHVIDMMQEIHTRGWEIGLHPSWYSFDDVDELKRQKHALEKALGHEIISVRQHHLHYDIRVTPKVHAEAGFKFDSTLGFNDNLGFRLGTCYPLRLHELSTGNVLPITEIPLIVQDGAMLKPSKGMRLDQDTAFEYVKLLTLAVEKVGGVLTLLWHPNTIINPEYWQLYLQTLDYLKGRNAWFGSIKEIMANQSK